MNKALEFVKDHPVGMAIGAAVMVGGYILLSSGGSSGSSATTGDAAALLNAQSAAVQYGSQLQIAQIAANQDANKTAAQEAIASKQLDVQALTATLQSQDTLAGITTQGAVDVNKDTLSAETTQAVSVLQARVAENQTAAAVESQRIQATQATTLNAENVAALTTISNNNTALQVYQTQQNAAVQNYQNTFQYEIEQTLANSHLPVTR